MSSRPGRWALGREGIARSVLAESAAGTPAVAATAAATSNSRPSCRFFRLGTCKFGRDCSFSHSPSAEKPVCSFYMSGQCRYGYDCVFAHPPRERRLSRSSGGGGDDASDYTAAPTATTGEGESEKDVCGVCFDSIPGTGKRFGLLTGCDHVFCLECIKSWRQSASVEKRVSRSCPSCRATSFFVVPSARYLEGEAKECFIADYKEGLSKTRCKHFRPPTADSPGEACPFGVRCFYAHLNADGTPCTTPAPRRWQEQHRRCPAARWAAAAASSRNGSGGGGGGRGGGGSVPINGAILALLMQEVEDETLALLLRGGEHDFDEFDFHDSDDEYAYSEER